MCVGSGTTNPTPGSVRNVTCMNVPIFPVRYAVADRNSNTPAVSGNFTSPNNVAAPAGRIHYTLRRPRRGYIYVFNEVEKKWSTFTVSEYGMLASETAAQKQASKPQPTMLVVSETMAVEIPAEPAQEAPPHESITCTPNGLLFVPQHMPVWLCFTNSRLHPKTLEKATSDSAFRDRFMRRLDPSQWQGKRHTAPLQEARVHVADLVGPVVPAPGAKPRPLSPKAFWFSQHPFAQQTMAQLQASTCKDAQEHGVVLALEDPAGIAMDLATFMNARMVEYDDKLRWDGKFVIGSAIGTLKASVIQQGEDDFVFKAKLGAIGLTIADAESSGAISASGALGDTKDVHLSQVIVDEQSEAFKAGKKRAGMEAWQKNSGMTTSGVFQSHLKESELEDYLQKKAEARAKHIQDNILYIAKIHAAWMQSRKLLTVFACHYYPRDPSSSYTELMHQCIDATQGWEPCGNLYTKWLKEAESMAPDNLLARALANNHSGVIQEAKKLAQKLSTLKPDQMITVSGVQEPIPAPLALPLDALVAAYKSFNMTVKTSLGLLLHEVSGPMGVVAKEMLERTVGSLAVCMMVSQTGKKLVMLSVVGTEQEFLAGAGKLCGQLQEGSSRTTPGRSIKKLRKAVGVGGKPTTQRLKEFRRPVKVDRAKLRPGAPKVWKWVGIFDQSGDAAGIRSIRDLERCPSQEAWKELTGTGRSLQAEGAFVMASGVLQIACLTKGFSDLQNTMAHEGREPGVRFAAGLVGLAGTVADGFSGVLNAQIEAALPAGAFAQAEQAAVYARRLKAIGRWLGFAAAVVNGVMDVVKAYRAYCQGDYKLMGLYATSAVTGVGMAAIFAFAPAGMWHPVGWLLLAGFLVTAYFINEHTASRIREWISRCRWARDGLGIEKYGDKNLSKELKDLELALGIDEDLYLNQWQLAVM